MKITFEYHEQLATYHDMIIHRVRKKRPPKQNAVTCTVYNTIQWHLHINI